MRPPKRLEPDLSFPGIAQENAVFRLNDGAHLQQRDHGGQQHVFYSI